MSYFHTKFREQGIPGWGGERDQKLATLNTVKVKKGNKLHALGRHLVLELNGCPAKLLSDVKVVEDIMLATAKVAKATIVGSHPRSVCVKNTNNPRF